jgi:hypothetical protein
MDAAMDAAMDAVRYAITCEGVVIGYSAFEVRGMPRGLLRGRFVPAAEYERLRPLFRAEALWHELVEDDTGRRLVDAAERARAALRFALQRDGGAPLDVAHVYVSEPAAADGAREVIAFLAARPAPPARAARRPVPSLTVRWVRRDGAVADALAWPGLDARLLALAPAAGACLRFVDPAGRTVFNRLQLPALSDELRYARAVARDAELARNAEWVLRFLARPAAGECDLWIEAAANGA